MLLDDDQTNERKQKLNLFVKKWNSQSKRCEHRHDSDEGEKKIVLNDTKDVRLRESLYYFFFSPVSSVHLSASVFQCKNVLFLILEYINREHTLDATHDDR